MAEGFGFPASASPPTAAGPTNWLPHALCACEAIRREARTELWMPCSALRPLWASCASRPKAAVSFRAVVSSKRFTCRRERMDVGSCPKRVSEPVFVFDVFGCLTFEVTCTRQRDTLARQGIMSIARTAGQVWHAVARQVHRRVRPHPLEQRQVLLDLVLRLALEYAVPRVRPGALLPVLRLAQCS
jgi:hypothetical protein